jgi:hypothetical protein
VPEPTGQSPSFVERRRAQRRCRRVPRPFRPDRRSGFDRRASVPGGPITRALRRIRDSRFGLPAILVAVNLLNIVDLLLTFRLLGDGAVEGNPLMRVLIGNDPILALIVKVGLVALATWGLWRQRRYRLVVATCVLVLAGFVAITGYEVLLLAPG